MFSAWRHRLTRKRRYRMLDGDLEQLLLGFDAIRSAQAVPARWSKSWDERLKRGHEVPNDQQSNYGVAHYFLNRLGSGLGSG